MYHANLAASPQDQELIVSRLQRERVPVVVLPVYAVGELENVYPILKQYLDSRYTLAKESGFGESRPFRILVDRQATPTHTDQELDLPCFSAG